MVFLIFRDALFSEVKMFPITFFTVQRWRADAVIVAKNWRIFFLHFLRIFLPTNIKFFVEEIYRKWPTFFSTFLAPYPPPPTPGMINQFLLGSYPA